MSRAPRAPAIRVTDHARLPTTRCTHAVVLLDPGAPLPPVPAPPERCLVLRVRDSEEGAGAPGGAEVDALLRLVRGLPDGAVVAFASPAGTTRGPSAAFVALCGTLTPARAMARARAAAPGFLPSHALAAAADRRLGAGGRIAAVAQAQHDAALAAAAGPHPGRCA